MRRLLPVCVATLLTLSACTDADEKAGDEAAARGDHAAARAAYSRAVENNPKRMELQDKLSRAEQAWVQAVVAQGVQAPEQDLCAVRDLGAEQTEAYADLGWQAGRHLVRKLEKERRILDAVQAEIDFAWAYPDCPTCPIEAGKTATKMDFSPASHSAFADLVRAWKEDATLHETMARWLADQNQRERAIIEYEKLVDSPAALEDPMTAIRLQVALKLLRGNDPR
jgi:hypothetical protein